MKWHLRCACVAVAALLSLGVAAGAQAQQTWVGDGNGLYTSTLLEEYQLPDGRTVRAVSLAGFNVSDDKESPFHLVSQDCSGTWVIEADGGAYSVAGHCVSRDADSDVFWFWWSGDASGGEFGMTSGTGKFAGMEGGGTYTNLAQMPDGKIINAWHAEVTMAAGMTMR